MCRLWEMRVNENVVLYGDGGGWGWGFSVTVAWSVRYEGGFDNEAASLCICLCSNA